LRICAYLATRRPRTVVFEDQREAQREGGRREGVQFETLDINNGDGGARWGGGGEGGCGDEEAAGAQRKMSADEGQGQGVEGSSGTGGGCGGEEGRREGGEGGEDEAVLRVWSGAWHSFVGYCHPMWRG
jgi:hypothetical protein